MRVPTDRDRGIYGPDPIYGWFGLSYCAYLILPRSVLQAMSEDWQRRFLRLISEIEETLEYEGADNRYMVKRRAEDGRFLPDPLANYRYPPPIRHKEVTMSDKAPVEGTSGGEAV